jgi:anti-sigma28 factor (negative regulator of flagellin synthesis)
MSSVNSIGPNSPVQKIIQQPVTREVSADAPAQQPAVDKLELSGMSHLLQALKTNDIRADKVAAIKVQIEAGTYETDDKLDIAADRLLDDLLKWIEAPSVNRFSPGHIGHISAGSERSSRRSGWSCGIRRAWRAIRIAR